MSETADINTQLDKRAKTLRSLYTTKDVLPENQEVKKNLQCNTYNNNSRIVSYIHTSPSWAVVYDAL